MKKILFVCILMLSAFCDYGYSKAISGGVNDTLILTFKVNGTSSCKANIESALSSLEGVISASWDASSKNITVKYLSTKVQPSDMHSQLALAGYDTSELRAKQNAYDALSNDCKYTRDPETN